MIGLPLSASIVEARLRLGIGAQVRLSTYDDDAPILVLETASAGASVTISASHDDSAIDADVAFAKELAEVAQEYLLAMQAHAARVRTARSLADTHGERG